MKTKIGWIAYTIGFICLFPAWGLFFVVGFIGEKACEPVFTWIVKKYMRVQPKQPWRSKP